MSHSYRLLLYSHDSYGLGHLRRSLVLAGAFTKTMLQAQILIATGSPRAQSFTLPARCDTIKLPCVTKDPDGTYRSRSLGAELADIVRLRRDLLSTAADAFDPHLILVDHTPAGLEGELLPILHRNGRRLVLGLRDIIDDADHVRRTWDRDEIWDLVRGTYDQIFVYGDRRVLTTAEELGLPAMRPDLAFTGYLGRSNDGSARAEEPEIVVAVGGGGDGGPLLQAYARYLAGLPGRAPFRSLLLTGPLLSPERRNEIAELYRSTGQPVRIVTFSEHAESLVRRAWGVISMAGYNNVVEVLSARVPALLIPRDKPRREQLLRAHRLAPRADLEVCSIPEATPERIGAFVERCLDGGPAREPAVDLDGVQVAAARVQELIAS